MTFLAEQLFHDRLNARHASLSADQHHFVDLRSIDARIFQALFRRPNRALQNILDHRFELRARQLNHQVLRPRSIRRNKRQIDLRLHGRRKLNLRPLRRIAQTLQSHLVPLAAEIQPFILLELVNQPIHQPLIDVVAAKVRVAIRGLHFNDALADLEHRNIKRAAAKVINGDGLVLALVEPISQSRRRGLIDDALNIQSGDLSGILSRLPLCIIKVSRHRDHRLGHFLAEVVFRRLLQLLQNHRGDLRRGVFLPLRQNRNVVAIALNLIWDHLQLFANLVIAASHKPLDRENRVLRIGNRLPLSHLPHQPFASLGESNHRRSGPPTLFIRDNLRLSALHNRHAGVRSPQVNSNNLSHSTSSDTKLVLYNQ